jgi:hypothetical protein
MTLPELIRASLEPISKYPVGWGVSEANPNTQAPNVGVRRTTPHPNLHGNSASSREEGEMILRRVLLKSGFDQKNGSENPTE